MTAPAPAVAFYTNPNLPTAMIAECGGRWFSLAGGPASIRALNTRPAIVDPVGPSFRDLWGYAGAIRALCAC